MALPGNVLASGYWGICRSSVDIWIFDILCNQTTLKSLALIGHFHNFAFSAHNWFESYKQIQYFSMPLTFLQECEDSAGIHRNGTGIRWNGTGIHRNPQEWDWIPQELLYSCRNRTGICRNGIYWIKLLIYIYIYLYLLNSLHIYKCLYFYICIYWSAFIYLNYYLLPFNIMNLQGLEMHGDMSRAS